MQTREHDNGDPVDLQIARRHGHGVVELTLGIELKYYGLTAHPALRKRRQYHVRADWIRLP